MKPTIYKPSIYKGAGIYKAGAEGGGGDLLYYDSDFTNFNINTLEDKFANGTIFTWQKFNNIIIDKRKIDGKNGLFVSNIDYIEAWIKYPFIEVVQSNKIICEVEFKILRAPAGNHWITVWPLFITKAHNPGTGACVSNYDYTIIDGEFYANWSSPGINGSSTTINGIMTKPFPDDENFHTGKCIIDKINDSVEYYFDDNLFVKGKFGNFQENFLLSANNIDFFISRISFMPF